LWKGYQKGNLERVSWNGGIIVSWKEQAARVFEAGHLVSFFLYFFLVASMLNSPRFASCALSVFSPHYSTQDKMKLMTRKALAASLMAASVGLCTGTAQGQATVYEGFDYAAIGNMSGLNGGTGFASGWESVNVWWRIASPGSTHGSLAVAGNKATSITRSGISRFLNSDLSNAGLLDNGSTLWFSAIVDITTGSAANSNLGFALTNSTGFRAPASNPAWHDLDYDGTTTDEGIGFAYNAFGQIGGAYWQDDDAGADAYSERVFSNDRINGVGAKLILGKIEWGADGAADEKLSLYEPDVGLNIGTAVLADWAIPALDQGTFNRIAIMGKDTPSIDEIRFGATSAAVMPMAGGPILFCNPANAHSGGGFATLGNSGFDLTGLFHLEASNGPDNQFGYFLVSAGSNDPGVPVSQGRLCLEAPIGRYSPAAGGVLNSIGAFDVGGVFQNLAGTSSVGSGFDVPLSLPSPPGGMISTGDTWHFQLWYRDGPVSNFSDGVSVTF